MAKVTITSLLLLICFSLRVQSQQLTTVYDTTMCGLNYIVKSSLLTKRVSSIGSGFVGANQPALLSISGIPAGANIEQAYVWWDIAGDIAAQVNNVIVQGPSLQTDTFPGVSIGGGNSFCWGKGYAFRADVTAAIEGNGSYFVSGLPSDSSLVSSDANGVTTMIIYSDPYANYAANININNGYVKIDHDTVIDTLKNIVLIKENSSFTGKGFVVISDLENKAGYSVQINGGPFLFYPQGFWDYEEKATAFLPNQKVSLFGVRSPNDCSHLLVAGVYHSDTVSGVTPIISQSLDTLESTLAGAFQWFLNDTLIVGATAQQHIAERSGVYRVETSNEFGCLYSSDTLTIITCKDQIQPNINFVTDSLWTDSVGYALQWYHEDTLIPSATMPYYIAIDEGVYKVEAIDTAGDNCRAFSDTLLVLYAGSANETGDQNYIKVYPNPTTESFTLEIGRGNGQEAQVVVSNINGSSLLHRSIDISSGVTKTQIYLGDLSSGVYTLTVKTLSSIYMKKLIVQREL